MSIGSHGENLIFLISQPRAGSTLSQRILGNHPKIYTLSEPWLMLHPLSGLRSPGVEADYNAERARTGIQDFLQSCPEGENDYYNGVRQMGIYLYNQALQSTDKTHFLDKTPRYYFIIPELAKTFPNAQFIILVRNPLAVFCSILDKWRDRNGWLEVLERLDTRACDLVTAPTRLLAGIDLLGDRCTILHYEQLVNHPEQELQRLCDRLNLKFTPDLLNYGDTTTPDWQFGDDRGIHLHSKPNADYAEKWQTYLNDPIAWRLLNDYLHQLGQDTITGLDYDYEQLRAILSASCPSFILSSVVPSLTWTLNPHKTRSAYYWILYAGLKLARLWPKISQAISRTGHPDRYSYSVNKQSVNK